MPSSSYHPGGDAPGCTTLACGAPETLYGEKSIGSERSPFVSAADGTVAKVFRKVTPEEHAAQVLEALG